jgi:hypothetical protein
MLALITDLPVVMEVHPSVPAKTLAEFVAYARQNPGKLNFGSAGTGGTIHLAGEMFKQMAGVDLVHVPYKGAGPALTDLLFGQYPSDVRSARHSASPICPMCQPSRKAAIRVIRSAYGTVSRRHQSCLTTSRKRSRPTSSGP